MKSIPFYALWGQRIFLGAAFLNLISEILNLQAGIYLSKPLLMPTLALSLLAAIGSPKRYQGLVLAGLILSWLGDVLLIFASKESSGFFIAGLGSFLLAHLAYLTAFWSRSQGPGQLQKHPWLIFPYAAYLILLNTWWWEELGELRTPVVIYSIVISAMALSALHLKGQIEKSAWNWLFFGAILFVISDTILAINKFMMPLPGAGFWIMATYILAQYGIVRGSR